MPVLEETRVLWLRAVELNLTYEEPRVAIFRKKWELEELNWLGPLISFPRLDAKILNDRES
jgi:hypothetical protein